MPNVAAHASRNACAAAALTLHMRQASRRPGLRWTSAAFDIALLDVGLPDGSGFDVARLLREKSPGTAMVFLTAYGTPEDRIQGLELGADDYVTKPFVFRELVLRLQNVLKSGQLPAPTRRADRAASYASALRTCGLRAPYSDSRWRRTFAYAQGMRGAEAAGRARRQRSEPR